MKHKHLIGLFSYTTWCGLGFYRGTNYYKYTYNNYDKNKNYLYIDSIGWGLFGFIMYANPVGMPFFSYKELYRLEINLRKLKKNEKEYNDLF